MGAAAGEVQRARGSGSEEQAAGERPGVLGGALGLPGALLQPCFSLRRRGDSMLRRPAWQVGPGEGWDGTGQGGWAAARALRDGFTVL